MLNDEFQSVFGRRQIYIFLDGHDFENLHFSIPSWMIRISFSEYDPGVSDVADEELSPFDKADGGCGAGRRGETGSSFLPVRQILPHGLLRRQEPFSNGFEDKVVIVGPEVLLFRDRVHQMVLKIT